MVILDWVFGERQKNKFMKEYITEAIVLDIKAVDEYDRVVEVFSKEFGYLKAKLISGRRFLSKLSPHLDILNLVDLRLVEKNQIIVADALTKDRFFQIRENYLVLKQFLDLVYYLKNLVFFSQKDLKLWYWLLNSLKNVKINYLEFLKILGYDHKLAKCYICQNKKISYFHIFEQFFLCFKCAGKFKKNDLIYIINEIRRH